MNLEAAPPRSPAARLGGVVWLPRLIDKTRATLAGTAGGYVCTCPIDVRLFQFLDIPPEDFLDAAMKLADDGAMMHWVKIRMTERSPAAQEEFNAMLAAFAPSTDASRRKFSETVDRLAPGRTDLTTWFQLLDLEEGRLPAPA